MGKMKAVWQAEQDKVRELELDNNGSLKREGMNNDPWNLWDDDGGDSALNNADLGALMARWEEL